MNNNSIMTLDLYKTQNAWVFDDPTFDIVREPFVLGMSEIISSYLDEDATTCTIFFCHQAFPTCETLILEFEEAYGGWYSVQSSGMRGWLCPATRIYMNGIPENIYLKVQSKK